jgi:hypothetical protein
MTCEKKKYSKIDALIVLSKCFTARNRRHNFNRKEKRMYYCKECHAWHLTSQNKLEYARVGFLKNLEVYVMTDDPGYIPHFHIRDAATKGKEFDTCVEICTNKYFCHGQHTSKLNAQGRKALAEFMEGKCSNNKYENNYELTVDMWNLNNSSVTIEYQKGQEIPNYRQITE